MGGGGAAPSGAGGAAADPLAGMPPLASLGRRLLARIIDALIIGVPVSVVLWLAMGDYDMRDTGYSTGQPLLYALVYVVYEGLMLTNSGQTVGKRLTQVRVAMLENGAVPRGQPGWFRAGTYALPLMVPCCGSLFWLVNVLMCTWDKPYRQCLHDKAAKTVVVDAR